MRCSRLPFPQVAAQLMLKHSALAIIPPNATITKAKNISMGAGLQMQTAASEELLAGAWSVLPIDGGCVGRCGGAEPGLPAATEDVLWRQRLPASASAPPQPTPTLRPSAGIIAKQPALLAVAPAALRPHAAAVLELAAVYEFYTLDWLQQQAKEQQKGRPASFATIHGQ
jgi:hypothetical protein